MRKFLYLLIITTFLIFMYAKYLEPFSLTIKEYSVESIIDSFKESKWHEIVDILEASNPVSKMDEIM